MKNDTRISIFIGYGKAPNISRLFVCLGSLLVVEQAWAEVGLPPPAQHQNAGFPSDQALQRRGYDPKTGVWKVDVQNNGKPTVTKNGGNINGSQGKTVTVTGRYGETGTMNTTVNQKVESGKLQKAANTIMIGNGIANGSNAASSYAAEVGRNIAQGNYGAAASNALQSVSRFIDGVFGGPISGIVDLGSSFGDGYLEGKYQNIYKQAEQSQRQAEAEGNYQKAVANAAAKKAAEAAQKAQQKDQQKKEEQKKDEEAKKNGMIKYQLIVKIDSSYQNYVFYSKSEININGSEGNTLNNSPAYLGRFVSHVDIDIPNATPSRISVSTPSDKYVIVYYNSYKEGTVPEAEKKKLAQNQSEVKAEDFMLTQKEMLDILKRMLENNQTNHAELMNQLAKMGVMNQSADQSTFSPDTALSAPYTPEGSSTPQQTRFKMNQDGTVGVDYVPRPDLKPNSPEAPNKPEKTTPSRQESPDTPNAPNSPNSPNTPNESNSQNKQNQNDKEKDFCQKNPNAAQCMPSGEDIQLPEQTIDLNFKPLDVFQSDGKCPAPRSVDFGALGQVEFSYDPLCDLARKLRPIFIAICVLTCAYFVYESVKEL
ncbi:virulence factor TspB C-terminal domain-related protein [Neisseria subflava]|uniref:virulence factor TspB C-terminal domain-related protein n=2 Tax=Neisseria TaxID=482 RepID=UPI000D30DFCC|nr:virulence factor TspB C-terminal domain-related protein [Neisseria subflava]